MLFLTTMLTGRKEVQEKDKGGDKRNNRKYQDGAELALVGADGL